VITDGEVVLAESGAIIEYLVDKYGLGRLKPPVGSPQALKYLYWMHYAEGSAMPPLLMRLVFNRIATNPAPWPVSAIARRIASTVDKSFIEPNLSRHLNYMEAELNAQSWFAGEDFSAADVQMSFPLEAAASRGGLNASRPKLMGFLERIHARDAYKRALERGGRYDF
jgi:glutathione S-transferase